MAREGTHNPPPSARRFTKAHVVVPKCVKILTTNKVAPVLAHFAPRPASFVNRLAVWVENHANSLTEKLRFGRSGFGAFCASCDVFLEPSLLGKACLFCRTSGSLGVLVYLCSEAANRLGVSAFGRLLGPVCRSSVHWRSRSHCSRLDSHCSRLLLHYERYAMQRKPARSKADRR